MTSRHGRDHAAIWLGVASIASILLVFLRRELHFLDIPRPGMVVALALGILAIAGGRLANRMLILAAGAGFLAAAIAQVALQTVGAAIANGGNGSTVGLWLGLGAGLTAVGLTPRAGTQATSEV